MTSREDLPGEELPREELMVLLDRERDGTLDDRGRARLAELVASDPELADEARELRALGDLFASVAPARAPDSLAADVLRDLHARPPRGRLLRLAPLLSATAAAALVIGLFLANSPDAPREDAGGTAADVARLEESSRETSERVTFPAAAPGVAARSRAQVAQGEPDADPAPAATDAAEADAAGAAKGGREAEEAGLGGVGAPSAPVPAPVVAPTAAAASAEDAPSDRGDTSAARDDEERAPSSEAADADEPTAGGFGGRATVPAETPAREKAIDAGRAHRPDEPVLWVTELGGTRYAVFTDETAARAYAARLAAENPATPSPPPPSRAPASGVGAGVGVGGGGGGAAPSPEPGAGRSEVSSREVTVVADLRLSRDVFEQRRREAAAESLDVAASESAETATGAESKEGGARPVDVPATRAADSRVRAVVGGFLSRALADKLAADGGAGARGSAEAPAASADRTRERSTDRIVILLVR